jgi:hypothetical protein
MAALEKGRAAMLPAAMALGLLSANFARQTSPPTPAPSEQARSAKPGSTEPIASDGKSFEDLRPVMELMADALGVPADTDETLRAAQALDQDLNRERGPIVHAPGDAAKQLLGELKRRQAKAPPPAPQDLVEQAHRLDGYLASEIDPAARLHKLRDRVTDTFLREAHDNELLHNLINGARQRDADVRFLIATIPDYVDSNSGWYGDQYIGAIQLAMSRSNFVLDRFRLIDWSRAAPHSETQVAIDSRLHEKQPGALIFRSIHLSERHALTYVVVLLALETPTSGIHTAALRNAARLVTRWQHETGDNQPIELQIVGPCFSGSVLSLALTLRAVLAEEPVATASCKKPPSVSVISGAANVDDNVHVMDRYAPTVSYQTTLRSTSEIGAVMAAALGRMNSRWKDGTDTALLVESNTAYGASGAPTQGADLAQTATASFSHAFMFRFPLHIAQLRNDATPPTPATLSLLPSVAIPLNLRETTPPADQIPALNPQLTSSLVEAHVNSILDDLRHRGITAVGILATDDRDVLFLSREVKRAMPGVQLFFFGSDLLYLHPEYAPYMRGALVASTYPQNPADQRELVADETPEGLMRRATFSSMTSQGVYNATLRQLGTGRHALPWQRTPPLLDYCDPEPAATPNGWCQPPVWISVLGDDAYWPISHETPADPARDASASRSALMRIDGVASPRHLPRMPAPTMFVALLLLLVCGGHAGALFMVGRKLRQTPHDYRRLMALPVVRLMIPPDPRSIAASLHGVSLCFCVALIAMACGWVVCMVILYALSPANPLAAGVLRVALAIVIAGLIAGGIVVCRKHQRLARKFADPNATQIRPTHNKVGMALMSVGILLIVLAYLAFLWFIIDILMTSAPQYLSLRIARILAGGVVSPALTTLCLFAALYSIMYSGLRRLSFLGYGYTSLGHNSATFRLFVGGPLEAPGGSLEMSVVSERGLSGAKLEEAQKRNDRTDDIRTFAGILDLPGSFLGWAWPLGILVVLSAAAGTVGWTATVDGPAFTVFLMIASYASLTFGLLLLGQAVQTWAMFRPKLCRIAQSPLAASIEHVGSLIRWDLSLAPARSSELLPLVGLTTRLRRQLMALAQHQRRCHCGNRVDRRARHDVEVLTAWCESGLAFRSHDDVLAVITTLERTERLPEALTDELSTERFVPLLRSRVWLDIWALSDRLVSVLERGHWCRVRVPGIDAGVPKAAARWFATCERLIALQFAFLIRDILARIMWSLFSAMLCLTLVACAHLFYIFEGRSSLLMIDLVAIGVTALGAIRVLVEIERNSIISQLRHTTPGRIDFSWEFVGRIAVYGALPLLAVVASVFPEIGDSVFRWIEPLRKLTTF